MGIKKEITLIDIYKNLKAGDIVLKQVQYDKESYDKTELVIIVAVDIWDMAVAVYYVDYKDFNVYLTDRHPKVKAFGEWMSFWNVLGHWKKMPTFKQLLKAKRNEKTPSVREQNSNCTIPFTEK